MRRHMDKSGKNSKYMISEGGHNIPLFISLDQA
jgi:hypothetical protein